MSTQIRTSNQSRASTKIAIGFVVLVALGFGAKALWENRSIGDFVITPIPPSTVNLVGVDTRKGGYHIVVANGLAQLVRSPMGALEGGNNDPGQSDSSAAGSEKKRVPLKELILTLQGDPKSVDDVGRYVAVLNDMKESDLPTKMVIWQKEDLEKALAGDATLKTKLERDLNTKLDGLPLPEFRASTFDTGIVISLPVTLDTRAEAGNRNVRGNVLIPFETSLMRALYLRVGTEQIDEHKLAGYYAEVGKTYIDKPTSRQNVAAALKDLISKRNIESLTNMPQTVLDSIQILANNSMIGHATYDTEDTNQGKRYNIDIELTDEGRKRLWQFSKDHMHEQLLLVVDGVAVAAMRIGTELAQTHLTISGLTDERIVKDAVNKINAQAR